MNKKILAFIWDGKNFLLLRNNAKDPSHGGDYWYTVTGSVEASESLKNAVKREVKEETNLQVLNMFNLNWGSIYSWGGKEHSEKNFLVLVPKGEVKLNEEHIDFKWLKLERFVEKIRWDLNKEKLKKILQKAIKNELFFKREKINDFRKG